MVSLQRLYLPAGKAGTIAEPAIIFTLPLLVVSTCASDTRGTIEDNRHCSTDATEVPGEREDVCDHDVVYKAAEGKMAKPLAS